METTIVPYRLKVRIGANEFDAEGPEESVKEQYAAFLQALQATPQQAQPNGHPKTKVLTGPVSGELITDPEFDAIDNTWNRVYNRDDDKISLHVLPKTDERNADTIVLLLYGYQTLMKRDAVSSMDLMDAARQSGLRIDRIDRNLPLSYNAYLIKGGSGKGSRYSLSNPGRQKAQELLEELYN